MNPPQNPGAEYREAVWKSASLLVQASAIDPRPIPLRLIRERLQTLPLGAVSINTADGESCDIRLLYMELRRLGDNATTLDPPWPGPDIPFGPNTRLIWDVYSPNQILARARAVYSAAIEVYQELVRRMPPQVADRLSTYVKLPARLVGMVSPPRQGDGLQGIPTVAWYWEVLPQGSSTSVDLRLGTGRFGDAEFARARDTLKQFRPQAATWAETFVSYGEFDLQPLDPATQLANKWLESDLRQAGRRPG